MREGTVPRRCQIPLIAALLLAVFVGSGGVTNAAAQTGASPTGEDTPANQDAVAAAAGPLTFPIAYQKQRWAPNASVWIAGTSAGTHQVASGTTDAFSWSTDGRFVAFVIAGTVYRYDTTTDATQTWPCGGCTRAFIAAGRIYTIDSSKVLRRYPLTGTAPDASKSLTGIPAFSTHGIVTRVPEVVAGSSTSLVVTWTLDDGTTMPWGVYLELSLDGAYVRTQAGSDVDLQPVMLFDAAQSVDGKQAILAQYGHSSACADHDSLGLVTFGSAPMQDVPLPSIPPYSPWNTLRSASFDRAGTTWISMYSSDWVGANCGTSSLNLYQHTGGSWQLVDHNVRSVRFGPANERVWVRSPDVYSDGNLEVNLNGGKLTVDSNVTMSEPAPTYSCDYRAHGKPTPSGTQIDLSLTATPDSVQNSGGAASPSSIVITACARLAPNPASTVVGLALPTELTPVPGTPMTATIPASANTSEYRFSWVVTPPGPPITTTSVTASFGVANGPYAQVARAIQLQGQLADDDGDGLPNVWETQGVTVKSSGNPQPGNVGGGTYVPLPQMGANPQHKDLYLQVDHLRSAKSADKRKLSPSDLWKVQDTFAKAPIQNPDGVYGIALHIDAGATSCISPGSSFAACPTWGSLARAGRVDASGWDADANSANRFTIDDLDALAGMAVEGGSSFKDTGRNGTPGVMGSRIFRFACSCGRDPDNNYGLANGLPGTGFIITLDGPGHDTEHVKRVFIHEFGHTLGLHHGGNDDIRYKPNYESIMNYSYIYPDKSRSGVPTGPGHGATNIDYSRNALAPTNGYTGWKDWVVGDGVGQLHLAPAVTLVKTSDQQHLLTPEDEDPPEPGSGFHPVTPARILDSRTPTGNWSAALDAGAPRDLQVTGLGGPSNVPVTAKAVVLNVTATASTANSFLTIWQKGAAQPNASNLNFAAGQTIPNLVTVATSGGGKITIATANGSTDVIADVVGYYDDGSAAGDLYNGIAPTRLLDSRTSTGGWSAPLATGTTKSLTVRKPGNSAGVPSTATAVIANVTVTNATTGSFLSVWPAGVTQPNVSNLNFGPGQTIANLVTVKIGTNGAINFANANGSVHVILDVVGYYDPTTGSRFHPMAPTRILDDRDGTGLSGPWGPDQTRTLTVAAEGKPIPTGATGVVANITATNASAGSFITIYPNPTMRPNASTLNFGPGETIPNLSVTKLGNGKLDIYNQTGTVDIIADAVGWFSIG